jgi:N-acetylmuramoyl-L-alanine amidase
MPTPANDIRRLILVLMLLCGPAWLGAQSVRINNTDYLPLRDVATRLGMESHWVKRDEVVRLSSRWTTLEFTANSRSASFNGTKIFLGNSVVVRNGMFHLSQIDYQKTVLPIVAPKSLNPAPPLRRIILDAGHGGKDSGAENKALRLAEKNLTLDLAQRVDRLLQQKGFTVVHVRSDDRFIALEERTAIANRLGGDLFLSLHFNAAEATSVRGIENYAFTPLNQPSTARSALHSSDQRTYPGNANDTWNLLATYHIHRALVGATASTDRGIKRARFTVLRDLRMPGVLIEAGFVSHPDEGRNIGSPAYRQRLAQAIADGVVAYQENLNRIR